MSRLLWLVLCGLLLGDSLAYAHRVNVFAWVEKETVHIESSFSGGRKAKGARVQLLTLEGDLILEGETDQEGAWSFPVPEQVRQSPQDLTLVVLAGEGHRGEWPLKAEEYLVDGPEAQALLDQREGPGLIKIAGGVLLLLALAALVQYRRKKA